MFLTYRLSPLTVCQLTNSSIKTNSANFQKQCSELILFCLRHKQPINDFEILDPSFVTKLFKKDLSPNTDDL